MGELRQSAGGSLALNDLGHLLANGTDLRRAGVGGLLDLVGASLGEGNGEQAEEVVVSGLHGDVGLDQGLPLADKGTELVGGEVETVEVGQTVLALDLVDAELDLAEGVVLIVLEVGEGDLEDTALEGVVGVLQTAGAVDQSLADTDNSVSQSNLKFAMFDSGGVHTRGSGRWKEPVETISIALWDSERNRTHLHRVLVLASEGVDCALLDTLLTLR